MCLTLCDPMDCSPPGSFVLGILQARILEWVAIFSVKYFWWHRTFWQTLSSSSSSFFFFSFLSNLTFTVPVQFSSVAQSCPTLCNPMDCRTPGIPVQQQLPELAKTHVPGVSDANQSSHSLSSPSLPAFHLS